jgi:serine phosphatase RsbU (regulator of sigma subunit)
VSRPPGSVCALFTDGLVERRSEHIDLGLDRVAVALDAADPHESAERVTTRILDTCTPDHTDDVWLLVLVAH